MLWRVGLRQASGALLAQKLLDKRTWPAAEYSWNSARRFPGTFRRQQGEWRADCDPSAEYREPSVNPGRCFVWCGLARYGRRWRTKRAASRPPFLLLVSLCRRAAAWL